ncbi:hypothetical protein NENIHHPF_00081 [Enterococcus phage EF_FB]
MKDLFKFACTLILTGHCSRWLRSYSINYYSSLWNAFTSMAIRNRFSMACIS